MNPYRDSLDLSPLSRRFCFIDGLFLDLKKIIKMILIENYSHSEVGNWQIQLMDTDKDCFYLSPERGAQVFNALKAYRCQ